MNGETAFNWNGNMRTAGPAASYTDTPQKMLQSATANGLTTSYTSDADDSRTKKSANGSTTTSSWRRR